MDWSFALARASILGKVKAAHPSRTLFADELMESVRHVFEKTYVMKEEGFNAAAIIDYLHREGHGFGMAVRVMEKNFSMSRPEAEKAVVGFSQYAQFAPMRDEEDPTKDVDFTIEF